MILSKICFKFLVINSRFSTLIRAPLLINKNNRLNISSTCMNYNDVLSQKRSGNHKTKPHLVTQVIEKDAAERVLAKRPVKSSNLESIAKTLKVLSDYNFEQSSIKEFPDILTIPPAALENYILILQESCFLTINTFMLDNYVRISKKSINTLKTSNYILKSSNVLENYFKILDLPPDLENKISKYISLTESSYENYRLVDLRLLVLNYFLSHILCSPLEEVEKMTKQYPRLKFRSFNWILKNLSLLQNQINFSKETILKHGYLLQGIPSQTEELLAFEKICNMQVKEIFHLRPKILMTSPVSIRSIINSLKSYGIEDDAIMKCFLRYPEIFTLAPTTVDYRLNSLSQIPEFQHFKTHPRIGRFIYYFTKVKERMSYLKSIDISGVSLHILSTDKDRFAKYIELGELKNKGSDIVIYLSAYFNIPRNEIRKQLNVHPHWLQVPAMYVKEVIFYLEEQGFDKSTIFKTLPILLYPIEKIKEEVGKLVENGENKNEAWFLDLVLYELEKSFHFSGDGIWTAYHQLRQDISEKDSSPSLTQTQEENIS